MSGFSAPQASLALRSCQTAYRQAGRRKGLVLAGLGLLLLGTCLGGICVGSAGFSPGQVLTALVAPWRVDDRTAAVIWSLRLPRAAAGLLIGAGLAWAGALAQAALRNALASPFTLGAASGAGFGAALAMFLWPQAAGWAAPGAAFAASLAVCLVMVAVGRLPGAGPETLILAGVAVMFLFSALTSLIQYAAPQQDLPRLVFWFFGSLSKAGWSEIGAMAALILAPLPWLMRRAWDLNLLPAGDETAKSLGVDVDRLRALGVLVMALMTAGAICFTGVIGFIGLVAPHLGRLLVGGDHRYLLPAAGLLGAVLVTGADLVSRWLLAPQILPIGIATSFLGAPFFFWLLVAGTRRGRRC